MNLTQLVDNIYMLEFKFETLSHIYFKVKFLIIKLLEIILFLSKFLL
jgi:hypothetical protein